MLVSVEFPDDRGTVEWPIDSALTYREAGVLKDVAGLDLADIAEAIARYNPGFMVAITVVAARRNGDNTTTLDDLLDLPSDAITIDPAWTPPAAPATAPKETRTRPGQRHVND